MPCRDPPRPEQQRSRPRLRGPPRRRAGGPRRPAACAPSPGQPDRARHRADQQNARNTSSSAGPGHHEVQAVDREQQARETAEERRAGQPADQAEEEEDGENAEQRGGEPPAERGQPEELLAPARSATSRPAGGPRSRRSSKTSRLAERIRRVRLVLARRVRTGPRSPTAPARTRPSRSRSRRTRPSSGSTGARTGEAGDEVTSPQRRRSSRRRRPGGSAGRSAGPQRRQFRPRRSRPRACAVAGAVVLPAVCVSITAVTGSWYGRRRARRPSRPPPPV